MTVSKRVAKSGAVTLPRQLRQETGILPGVPVDIEADEDGVHKPVGVLSHCLQARNGGKRCYSEKHRQVRETTMRIDNFCGSDVTANNCLEH